MGEPSDQRLVNGETILLNTGLFSRWEKEAHCDVPGVSKDSCLDPHEDNEHLNKPFISRNAFSFTIHKNVWNTYHLLNAHVTKALLLPLRNSGSSGGTHV